jgi:hypothetical protein
MDDDDERIDWLVVVVKRKCGTGKRTTAENQKELSMLVVGVSC